MDTDSESDITSDEDWDKSFFETVIIENLYDTISDDEDVILSHLMTLDMRCFNMFGAELAPSAVMEVALRWPRVEQPPGTGVRENKTLVPAGAEVVEEVQLDDLTLANQQANDIRAAPIWPRVEQSHESGLGQNEVLAPAGAEMEDEDELVDLTLVNRQADEADDLEVMKNYLLSGKFLKFWKNICICFVTVLWTTEFYEHKGQKIHLELKCIFQLNHFKTIFNNYYFREKEELPITYTTMDSKSGNNFCDIVMDTDSESDIASDEDWDESFFEIVIIEHLYDTISDDEDVILSHLMILDMRCFNMFGVELAHQQSWRWLQHGRVWNSH